MNKISVTFFNLGILLTAMLGLNLNTNATFDQLVKEDYLAYSNAIEYNRFAALETEDVDTKLEEIGIKLHPGTDYNPESKGSPRSLNHCKSLVYGTLRNLPAKPVSKLKHLTLYFAETGRRGLGGGDTVILRCQNVTDEELVGVLVHEMGHIMDTGVMDGTSKSGKSGFMDGRNPVYNDDDSLMFYRYSFTKNLEVKKGMDKYDFVSTYAMTDPYEDFAESYAYYVLHGKEFRKLAKYNEVLEKKYNYLKTRVFNGKEYLNGYEDEVDVLERKYDVTVLPYEMSKFMVI